MTNLKRSLVIISVSILLIFASKVTAYAAAPDKTELSYGCTVTPGVSQKIPLYILNTDSKEHEYTLTTEGMTNVYELYFTTNDNPVTSVKIPGGEGKQIELNLLLKSNTAVADKDSILIKTLREDGKEEATNISVLLNKDYSLVINSMMNKVEVLSGKAAELSFSIKNTGSKELNAVKLKANLPYKWIISQGADTSINLKPGETGTITINIEVPSSQTSGNFPIDFAAQSTEIKSDSVRIEATVKASSSLAYWMIGILILLAGITIIQLKKHGRR